MKKSVIRLEHGHKDITRIENRLRELKIKFQYQTEQFVIFPTKDQISTVINLVRE